MQFDTNIDIFLVKKGGGSGGPSAATVGGRVIDGSSTHGWDGDKADGESSRVCT